MKILRPAIALAFVATGFILPTTRTSTRVLAPRSSDATENRYARTAKEYYLTAEQTDFVRPGFKIKVNSVKIGADRKPVVDVNITDDVGQPVDRLGILTPGPTTTTYILSWYDPATRNYTSYATRVQTSPITGNSATQAAAEYGGTFTDNDHRHLTKPIKTGRPAGFDSDPLAVPGYDPL